MPKIAEIREIDGEVWVRVGKAGEFPSGITLWTPEEEKKKYQDGWHDAVEAMNDAVANMEN